MVIWFFRCIACGHVFATDNEYDTCPKCGQRNESHDYRVET